MQYNSNEYEPMDVTPVKPGDYDFTVIGATESTSQSGNDMISLELQVNVPGRENPVKVYDYLVSTPKALFKIESFCGAVGLNFGDDELVADSIIGLNGRAKFVLGLPKDNGNRYLEVRNYIKAEGYTEQPFKPVSKTAQKQTVPPATPLEGDDLPF